MLRKHRQDGAGDEDRDVVAGKQRLEFSGRLRNRGIIAAGKRDLGVGLATQRPQRQRLAQPGAAAHVGQLVQDRQALLQKATEHERAASKEHFAKKMDCRVKPGNDKGKTVPIISHPFQREPL
jgi:hypothetical protein